VAAHHRQLEICGASLPENFETARPLVSAEIARIRAAAPRRRAVSTKSHRRQEHGFIQTRPAAAQARARFYAARASRPSPERTCATARYCYLRWGADGKVQQLDESYPHLREELPPPRPTTTIGASVEHLDLATVVKVSQAVSGEIVLEKLIDTLMRTALDTRAQSAAS